MTEQTILSLIMKLRKRYLDGEGNADLSERAILIHNRIEVDRALARNEERKLRVINVEESAFKRVVDEIRIGRDHPSRKDSAMKDFDDYVREKSRANHAKPEPKKRKK